MPDRRLLVVALAAFGVLGGLWGAWAVLLADLSWALDLSAGHLGLALSGGAVASIPAMVVGGRAADRWGRRGVLVVSGILMAASFAGLALAGNLASFVVVQILWCATSGVYDVGLNALAMDLERTTGRRMLAPLHAAFSGGGAVGALTAGALVSVGVDYRYVYLGALLPVAVAILAVGVSRFPDPTILSRDEGEAPVKKPSLTLALVGVIAALAYFSEGTMEDWSGVYLRETLALPALLGASGVAVYHAAMAVGRLAATRTIKIFGNRQTLLGAGFLQAGGMTLALATREPFLTIAGFLVVGLSVAAVAPIAFSVAGDLVPDRVGGASSVVATLGYSGFIVGPAVVGGLAHLSDLRMALWSVVTAGLLTTILAGRLEGRKLVKVVLPLEEATPYPASAAPVPDFWFRTRPNGSPRGEYGRLHGALQRAHRPVPPRPENQESAPDRVRLAPSDPRSPGSGADSASLPPSPHRTKTHITEYIIRPAA